MEQSERGARFPGDGTGVPTVRQVVAARLHRGRPSRHAAIPCTTATSAVRVRMGGACA